MISCLFPLWRPLRASKTSFFISSISVAAVLHFCSFAASLARAISPPATPHQSTVTSQLLQWPPALPGESFPQWRPTFQITYLHFALFHPWPQHSWIIPLFLFLQCCLFSSILHNYTVLWFICIVVCLQWNGSSRRMKVSASLLVHVKCLKQGTPCQMHH